MGPVAARPVVGFISTWPVYQGTTIDRHAHALLQGIRAAAREEACDLLLGVAVGVATPEGRWRSLWSVPASDSDLVPIGPWNTDGLIVVSDDLTEPQAAYLRDLAEGGLPIVCTTPEAPGPRVLADNAGGIRLAVEHLVAHGHQRIAYVAGRQHRRGDSAQRAKAFHEAMRDAGLSVDPALVEYGEHQRAGGRTAMERILASGEPFTAFLASNDLSCLGAIEALDAAGKRVPEDVAAVGFDDILDARSHTPPLTTVRYPTFALGAAALTELVAAIRSGASSGRARPSLLRTEPTRLIVRRSCGCLGSPFAGTGSRAGDGAGALALAMAEAAFGEAHSSTLKELRAEAADLIAAILDALATGADEPLIAGVERLLGLAEARAEDGQSWQDAISVLYRDTRELQALAPDTDQARLVRLLDIARLEVSEHVQRQTSRAFLDHLGTMSQVALLTTELLATQDLDTMSAVLRQHLPALGIDTFLACRYVPVGDDPVAVSEVILSHGTPGLVPGDRFPTRSFPPRPRDAALVPIEWQVLPLRSDEAISGFVAMSSQSLEPLAAIVSTVTSAIRTARLYREAIESRRQAEEASAHRSRFLSMVSHELRTPLGVVVGLSDLILREAADGPVISPPLQQDLERMATSASHLGRLIDDVLDLASGQAGLLRLALEPVDLSSVLERAAATGLELARSRDLGFETDLPQTGPWVMGDATRLQQVALNLIGNAVKFTDEGVVRFEASTSVTADGGAVVTVAVSDTGAGLTDEQLVTLFSEDRPSVATSPTRRSGLGLGLAISRNLVELHGGSIHAASPGPDGLGSRFWFTLPVIVHAAGANPGADPIARGRHPLVLVVDDDPDTCALHARAVADAGARAIRATDAAAALDALARQRPDLVLLDLGLGDQDGFHVLTAMRQREATSSVPVIVITGRSVGDPDLDRLRPGVAGVVRKGVLTSAELAGRIRLALAGGRSLPGATQQLVRRAVSWIEEHHAEPIVRDDIARHVAISPDYLTDCFQQEVGMSPMTYLGRCRIRHARELLTTTDRSVMSVALSVGYSDVSHFTRTFHREVGVSPRVYRRAAAPGGDGPPGGDHPAQAQEHPAD